MGLAGQLRTDLTAAMRRRDEVAAATLRMLMTAVRTAEVAGEVARQLSDDEVLGVVRREIRKRREAASAFEAAGRVERAERERAELDVLEGYLPSQLTDDELTELVRQEVAAATGAGKAGGAAIGAVIRAVQPRVAGRADGARVAAEVRRQLQR